MDPCGDPPSRVCARPCRVSSALGGRGARSTFLLCASGPSRTRAFPSTRRCRSCAASAMRRDRRLDPTASETNTVICSDEASLLRRLSCCCLACANAQTRSSRTSHGAQTQDAVVAEVGGRKITLKEVDDRWQAMDPGERARVTQLIYQNRRNVLEQMVGDMLIEEAAKAAGLAVAQVPRAGTAEAPEAGHRRRDPAVLTRPNKDRAQGRTLEQLRQPISEFLTAQRQQQARAQLVDELKKKAAPLASCSTRRARTVAVAADDPVKRPGHARRSRSSSSRTTSARSARGWVRRSTKHARDLRRQGPDRVQGLPAAEPCRGAEGGRGGALRRRAGQVLGECTTGCSPTSRRCRFRSSSNTRRRSGSTSNDVRPVPRLGEARSRDRRRT